MDFKRKKILIVDDDRNMAHAIRRLLSVEGKYEIEGAVNGDEAEKKLENFLPDLIILDIKMPGKSGYEVLFKIREDESKQNVKVIGISGISGGIGASFMEILGADAYFEKPFDNQEFTEKIFKLLEENVRNDKKNVNC